MQWRLDLLVVQLLAVWAVELLFTLGLPLLGDKCLHDPDKKNKTTSEKTCNHTEGMRLVFFSNITYYQTKTASCISAFLFSL